MINFILTIFLVMVCVLPAEAKTDKHNPAEVKSFLVANIDGTIIREKDSDAVRPIASISKLMVALLAVEQDLAEKLSVTKKREVQSSIPTSVDFLTRKELLTLALVKSDNLAAQILCNNLHECVSKMNERAAVLGMSNTHFSEPTGLSQENVSTARDLLRLLMVAAGSRTISELSSMPRAEITAGRQTIKINNTNPLTSKFAVILSKTGFTDPAGGCLVMIIDAFGGRRVFVLLGSKDVRSRIPDMERLVNKL